MAEMIISDNYKTAAELNQKIIFTAQMAQQNLFRMCCMLKRMRDEKLYKELGYPNFEDYCEKELGMKRRNAYNYISVIERVENVQSIAQIGMTKLSLLASLSESQQEEIQQNVNVEDISVRKLKEEIARLKEDKVRTETALKAQTDAVEAQLLRTNWERDRADQAEKNLSEANEIIKELESRPQGDEELQRQIDYFNQELMKADTRNLIDLQMQSDEYDHKIAEMTAEIERLQNQPLIVADARETFKVYYSAAINSLNQVLDFIRNSDGENKDFFVGKINELITLFTKKLQLQI